MSGKVRIAMVIVADHEAEMALATLMGKRELTVRELKAFRKRAQRCKIAYSMPTPEEGDVK